MKREPFHAAVRRRALLPSQGQDIYKHSQNSCQRYIQISFYAFGWKDSSPRLDDKASSSLFYIAAEIQKLCT